MPHSDRISFDEGTELEQGVTEQRQRRRSSGIAHTEHPERCPRQPFRQRHVIRSPGDSRARHQDEAIGGYSSIESPQRQPHRVLTTPSA